MKYSKLIQFAVLFAFLISVSSAQSFMFSTKPSDNTQITAKYLHPFYKDDNFFYGDIKRSATIYSLQIDGPITPALNLIVLANFTNYSYKANYSYMSITREENYSKTAFGNIYLALQFARSRMNSSAVNFEFGVYLPSASEEDYLPLSAGTYADHYYSPKYAPKVFTINLITSKWSNVTELFNWGFEAGPVVMIPTNSQSGNSVIMIRFGIGTSINIQNISVLAEFNGIMQASESAGNFSDRFLNTFGLGAGYRFGQITPQLYYKIDFNDYMKSIQTGVLGIKVNAEL